MALTFDRHRSENAKLGKQTRARAQFDSSYPDNGEAIDFTASPFSGVDAYTTVRQVHVDSPKTSTGALIAETVCSRVQYDPAAGKLIAYKEDGTSGVTAAVADATDLSTVYVDLLIIGE